MRAHVLRTAPQFVFAIVLMLVACFGVRAAVSREIVRDHDFMLAKATADSFAGHATPGFGPDGRPSLERLVNARAAWTPNYRPAGWSRFDLGKAPRLDFLNLNVDAARTLNAVLPLGSVDPLHAARPFVLQASAAEYMRAVKCLSAAVYYEAATEPLDGQRAVAQVVLNRLRTPGYPKSVCGVVFQGADKPGCQFTFACDGSLARMPMSWAWKNAETVAEQALRGYVMTKVGNATHYHASYVLPWWSPTLVRLGRIGQHIFYRRTGPALFAPYAGGELQITKINTMGRPQPVIMPAVHKGGVDASLQLANLTTTVTPDGRVHATISDPSTITVSNVPMMDGKAVLPTVHALISARAAYAKAQMEKRQDADAAPGAPVQMQVREVGTPSHQTAKAAAPVAVASAAPAL